MPKNYTLGEEIANSITHGVGTLLSIAGLIILVSLAVMHGDVWRIVSFSLYGSTLILLYLNSTLYHAITHKKAKHVFRILDHASIFLLIAGTYIPVLLVTIRGPWGWTLFGMISALAIIGIVMKAVCINRFEHLSVVIYILMGWFCMMGMHQIIKKLEFGGIVLLAAGGIIYTLGVVFYAWKRLPYNHMVWHIFVLAGSICHYFAFLFYVL
ncbi:MAG: hemolysin III family protein [bacterium]|nr:hemolysin III family protein [bacterium]MBU1918421.1 hemolysin III family protein [bacterium]